MELYISMVILIILCVVLFTVYKWGYENGTAKAKFEANARWAETNKKLHDKVQSGIGHPNDGIMRQHPNITFTDTPSSP